ncbi:NUDIX domain-containing protein [Plantibacter flavus]|uniref:NUDIX hydrolase n=1 Tax=Plantibacter flavus TaxID=150123 RepID=UPI003F17F3FF
MSSSSATPSTDEARRPRSGCGAAIIRDGRILLLERRRAPEAGSWGIPGGKVDWMERLEDAVRREVEEETGLDLGPVDLLCVVDHFEVGLNQHWISPVYLAEAAIGEPALREPDKHSGLGWFSLDDLPEHVTVSTSTAVAAYAVRRSPSQPTA